ncbi:MAG: alpha/beta fold hydrolase [Myxococcota bacterium]
MPHIDVRGLPIHYQEWGSGPQTVVLSHSFLVDSRMWEAQIEALAPHFRVIAYDHRGHGESGWPNTRTAKFGLEAIYEDGLGLLQALELSHVHWAGLSTGGFVGMRIAARRPDLIHRLVLMGTSAAPEALPQRIKYEGLFLVLRTVGFGPVVGEGMKAMFGDTFLEDPSREELRNVWRERIKGMNIEHLVRFGQAIFSRDDFRSELPKIRAPTLVMVGEEDRATPPARALDIASRIPQARLIRIPRAGHLSTIEEPARTSAEILSFFREAA